MSGECDDCGEHCLECLCDIDHAMNYAKRTIQNLDVKDRFSTALGRKILEILWNDEIPKSMTVMYLLLATAKIQYEHETT
jgi:hypothetical protein